MKKVIFIPFMAFLLFSCGSVEQLARHNFDSGYYKLKSPSTAPQKVYTEVIDDSLVIYPILGEDKKAIDTTLYFTGNLAEVQPGSRLFQNTFRKTNLDVDLTTAILKYRPPQKNVPQQLSANLNAAVYLGFRKDYYHLSTHTSPLLKRRTTIHHIGFDFGPFVGLGITPVNPSVTQDNVLIEYDGVVLEKGIAIYFGVDFLTFGVSLGFDNLLDENHKSWVYNQKPWIGLMLGIANF